MGQMTIYVDDDTEELVKSRVKGSSESASRWIAGAIRQRARTEWPTDVLALLGSWKDEGKDEDFPSVEQLRQGYGEDVPREKL